MQLYEKASNILDVMKSERRYDEIEFGGRGLKVFEFEVTHLREIRIDALMGPFHHPDRAFDAYVSGGAGGFERFGDSRVAASQVQNGKPRWISDHLP